MMDEILDTLNQAVGVKGSLIVHRDGFVVKSRLGEELDTEEVAALATAILRSTEKALRRVGPEDFSRIILTATHGKMILVNVDPTYLVVVTRRDIRLDLTLLEIEHAAYKVKNQGWIRTA